MRSSDQLQRDMQAADDLKRRAEAIRQRRNDAVARREEEERRRRDRRDRASQGAKLLAEALSPVAGIACRDGEGHVAGLRLHWGPFEESYIVRLFVETIEQLVLVTFTVKADDRRAWIEHDDTEVGMDVACGMAIDAVEAVATDSAEDYLPF